MLAPLKASTDGQFRAYTEYVPLAWEPMSSPNWQDLYRAALTESDSGKLNVRIEAASSSIRQRLEETDDSREKTC